MRLAEVPGPPPDDGRAVDSAAVPRFSPRLHRWFVLYLRRYFAKKFTGVRVSLDGEPPPALNGPAIVFANHASWWDPILFLLLSAHYFPEREGYGPMDARALEKYGFFKKLGAFPVERDSRRGAIDFLNTGRAILERPQATLWVTAEGRFTDPRRRPIRLAPGIAHLAKRLDNVALIPLAVEYPFWNEPRPEVLVRFGPSLPITEAPVAGARDLKDLFEEALEDTMNALSRQAQRRDPTEFTTLIDGRRGVGGVYDAWRRFRAMTRGEHFNSAHGDDER